MRKRCLWGVVLLLGIVTASGCSNFRSSRRLNVTPFAENTINLVADISYGLDATHAVHLRRYRGGEGIAEYREHWKFFKPVLRGIGIYSLGLVTISRSNISEEQRAEQLAEFLDRMFARRLADGRSDFALPRERVDEILADIRAQKTFLDALGAAQPFVDEVARFSGEYLDRILASQDEVEGWLIEQIEHDFVDVIDLSERAVTAQNRFLRSLALLSDYRQGRDPDALRRLLEEDVELQEIVPVGTETVDAQTLQALEDRLMTRLARTQKIKEQMAFDLDTYQQMNIELDELVLQATNNIKRTRLTILIWAGAHRRLAAGITDPAKIDMMGVAKKALDAAMPL